MKTVISNTAIFKILLEESLKTMPQLKKSAYDQITMYLRLSLFENLKLITKANWNKSKRHCNYSTNVIQNFKRFFSNFDAKILNDGKKNLSKI